MITAIYDILMMEHLEDSFVYTVKGPKFPSTMSDIGAPAITATCVVSQYHAPYDHGLDQLVQCDPDSDSGVNESDQMLSAGQFAFTTGSAISIKVVVLHRWADVAEPATATAITASDWLIDGSLISPLPGTMTRTSMS